MDINISIVEDPLFQKIKQQQESARGTRLGNEKREKAGREGKKKRKERLERENKNIDEKPRIGSTSRLRGVEPEPAARSYAKREVSYGFTEPSRSYGNQKWIDEHISSPPLSGSWLLMSEVENPLWYFEGNPEDNDISLVRFDTVTPDFCGGSDPSLVPVFASASIEIETVFSEFLHIRVSAALGFDAISIEMGNILYKDPITDSLIGGGSLNVQAYPELIPPFEDCSTATKAIFSPSRQANIGSWTNYGSFGVLVFQLEKGKNETAFFWNQGLVQTIGGYMELEFHFSASGSPYWTS